MLAELTATAHAFSLGTGFLDRVVGDFTPADWKVRDGAGHDPRWIVGHLAVCRNRVLKLMGMPVQAAPWEALFARGTSPGDLPADLDVEEMVAVFRGSQASLTAGWDLVTPEMLEAPLGRTLPDGTDTAGGAIRFLAWHEAYHLGQLGLLRRLAGKAGVA